MRADRQRRGPRGFTLVELLMAIAIASIVITTAIAVVAAAVKLKRKTEKSLEVSLAANVAAVQIQADMMNAGYRFLGAPYAFRHWNNFDTSMQLSGPSGPIDANGNCGASVGKVVLGTDVIEVAEGAANTALASSTGGDGVQTAALIGSEWLINLISGAPFDPNEPPATRVGAILLFADRTGLSCIGRVTQSATPTGAQVEMLNRDYTVNGSHNGFFTGVSQCPQVGMSVYRLGRRTRYMVCADWDTTVNNEQPALFRQVSDNFGNFQAPLLVQEGIEDLQVSPRQLNPPGAGQHTGASCVNAPGGAAYCYCADVPGMDSCNTADPIPFLSAASHPAKIRGARVMITAISRRRAKVLDGTGVESNAPNDVRPLAFDHAPPAWTAAGAGWARSQQSISVTFANLAMVSP